MKICIKCQQEGKKCICEKVDRFFDGVRHLIPRPEGKEDLTVEFEKFVETQDAS